MPGTALPALVVPRTSMGTRSQRSESSLNMRWATYPDAPVSTTRRLATVYLLDVDALHLGLGIAQTRGRAEGHGFVDPRQVILGQADRQRLHVLLEVRAMLGAWNGQDVLALREEPGERELGRSGALLSGDLLDPADEPEVVLEILILEARMLPATVVLGNVPSLLDPGAQQTASEGRVGDEGDAELTARGDRVLAGLPIEQRVLALHGADGMGGVPPPDGLGRRLRQSEKADLPALDEPRHAAHGVLDGHLRIDPVLVVEVDHVHAQALEARVAGFRDIGGPAVDEVALAVRAPHLAELGGHEHPVALAFDGAPEQLLVLAPAVHVRGVEMVDPEVEGAVDDADAFLVVALAIGAGHGHEPESDGGGGETAVPNLAHAHYLSSLKSRVFRRLAAAASRVPRGTRLWRHSINRRIEVVSYMVWSMTPRREKGETTMLGTRAPGPQRSTTGGATWSQSTPFSSWVVMITVRFHAGLVWMRRTRSATCCWPRAISA